MRVRALAHIALPGGYLSTQALACYSMPGAATNCTVAPDAHLHPRNARMSRYPQLRSAPIHEAVVDVRITAPEGFHASNLNAIRDSLKGDYPDFEVMRIAEFEFRADAQGTTNVKHERQGVRGLLFKSADRCWIVQCRVDGFTLSRLRPYSSFADVAARFWHAFGAYREVVRPAELTRIALRYINRFSVPMHAAASEYLRNVPSTPVDSAVLETFIVRQHCKVAESSIAFNLITAREVSADGRNATLIVDIDAFQFGQFAGDDARLRRELEALHEFKNDVFFSSITARSMEEFQREPSRS